jgi:hypothetical protein
MPITNYLSCSLYAVTAVQENKTKSVTGKRLSACGLVKTGHMNEATRLTHTTARKHSIHAHLFIANKIFRI